MRTRIICFCLGVAIVICWPRYTTKRGTTLRHGSFVPFLFQKNEKLIIAADSRALSLDGKQRAEDDCKIVKLGERSVFASSGYTSAYGKLGIVEFSNDFAREAYRKSPDDPREMVDFWIYNMGRALTVVASPASLASADKGTYRDGSVRYWIAFHD